MVNELVEEIKDLLDIPEVERIIHHKVKEVKDLLSKNIHLYRDLEESLLEAKPPKKPGKMNLCGHRFELTLIGKRTWIPSIPNFRGDCGIYDIIPQEVIDFIVKYKAKPGMPIMLRGFAFPGLKERKFDLAFEKIKPTRFTGIINEHGGVKKTIEIENYESQADVQEKYSRIKELNRCLLKNEDYYSHVTTEFECRWRPLLESIL